MTLMLYRALKSTFVNWPKAKIRNAYPKIHVSKQFDGHKVLFGEITHGDRGPNGRLFPNAYQKIQVLSCGSLFNKLLAEAETDKNGCYKVEYASNGDDHIQIRLLEKPALFSKWSKNDHSDRISKDFAV